MICYNATGQDTLGTTSGLDYRNLSGLRDKKVESTPARLTRGNNTGPLRSAKPTLQLTQAPLPTQDAVNAVLAEALSLYNDIQPLTGMDNTEFGNLALSIGADPKNKPWTLDLATKYRDALKNILTLANAAPQGKTKALVEEAKAVATKL